jgi:YidC/Oxa1 family membrane protein insertase
MQHKSTVGQARIKPKLNAIRKRYEGRTDRNVQIEFQSDIQNLYREEKVSASMGCLPLLVQLLIVMVLYQIVYNPLTYIAQFNGNDLVAIKQIIVDNFGNEGFIISSKSISEAIKSVLENAEVIDKAKGINISQLDLITIINQNEALFAQYVSKIPDFTVFGAINLAEKPTLALKPIVLIPVLTVVFQLGSVFITRLVSPKPDTSTPEAKQAQKTMMTTNLLMTLVSGYIAFSFPAIIGIYWIYQSIVGTVITVILHKAMPVPSYTPEQLLEIEAEYNKDYVRPEIPQDISLHHIDDYEDDDEYEGDDGEEYTDYEDEMPERRRFDKNGNKIRSLHFIDEDDEETDETKYDDGEENTDEDPDDEI